MTLGGAEDHLRRKNARHQIRFDSSQRAICTVQLDDVQATPTGIKYCREPEIYAP
jgi:hypothetical protein